MSKDHPFAIGIDGGQSKTSLIAMDAQGKILNRIEGPAMEHMGSLTPPFLAGLKESIEELCHCFLKKPQDAAFIGAALCGIDMDSQRLEAEEKLVKLLSLPMENLLGMNDGVGALWGSGLDGPLILLQHGTAFTSAIRWNDGRTEIFDSCDMGRIYDLRKELIVAVARMIDGRKKSTPLKDKLLDLWSIPKEEDFGIFLDYERVTLEEQLNTVDFIFQNWQEGEETAMELVDLAARDYGLMIQIMGEKLGELAFHVVFGGGLLDRAPQDFLDLCSRYSGFPIHIQRSKFTPDVGALLYMAHQKGMTWSKPS